MCVRKGRGEGAYEETNLITMIWLDYEVQLNYSITVNLIMNACKIFTLSASAHY